MRRYDITALMATPDAETRDLAYFNDIFEIISEDAKKDVSAIIKQMSAKMSERTAKILFVQCHEFFSASPDVQKKMRERGEWIKSMEG